MADFGVGIELDGVSFIKARKRVVEDLSWWQVDIRARILRLGDTTVGDWVAFVDKHGNVDHRFQVPRTVAHRFGYTMNGEEERGQEQVEEEVEEEA